jgi:hypothetical protein
MRLPQFPRALPWAGILRPCRASVHCTKVDYTFNTTADFFPIFQPILLKTKKGKLTRVSHANVGLFRALHWAVILTPFRGSVHCTKVDYTFNTTAAFFPFFLPILLKPKKANLQGLVMLM